MDDLSTTWIILIVTALGLDIFICLVLRDRWKKTGVIVVDEFWGKISSSLHSPVKVRQPSLSTARIQPDKAPAPLPPDPLPAPGVVPTEIIPVSVKTIGRVRRVQFSVDMPFDTTVEVSVGASAETGVRVEKREI